MICYLRFPFVQHKVGLSDFNLLKVVGKGNFGKVMQVRKNDTGRIYAMKVLRKETVLAADAVQVICFVGLCFCCILLNPPVRAYSTHYPKLRSFDASIIRLL